MRPGSYDPFLHKAEDIEKANFMVSDIMGLESEQMFIKGIVVIFDMDGFTTSHLTQKPLSLSRKQYQYLQV